MSEARDVPALRIVRGDATTAEVAALSVVLAALSGAGQRPAAPRSLWAATGRVRAPMNPGRGAWRASALPG